jgi:hypothetical protein
VTFTIVALGSSLQIRATCGFTRHEYSHTDVLLIAVLEGILSTAAVAATALLWRFPVPFIFAVRFAPILVSFFTAHVAVLRGRLLRRDSVLRGPILAFLPSFAAQSFQVVVYPALSTAFAASNEIGQITLVVVFPFIKNGMRFILRRLTQHLAEDGNESAVNSIEIAASTYQSMLMQNTSSPYAAALLIAIDIAQSFVSVFIFMPKTASVARSEILTRAAKLVRESVSVQHAVPMAWTAKSAPARVAPQESVQPAAVVLPDLHALPVIAQALELLHAAESLVFIEYLEVTLPIVNAVFVSVVSQLQSAEYSPRLRVYRHRPDELQQALANLAIYTVLQALSVFILHGVLRRRCRLDTTVLLAFLLARHAWAVQAKLIAWLGVMFQMPVLHYGKGDDQLAGVCAALSVIVSADGMWM